jgi:GDP-L-fucose synthase
MLNKNDKIYIAGHKGLVGGSIYRILINEGYRNLVTRTRTELDLTIKSHVESFFTLEKPDVVILAAALVGGIGYNNSNPFEFIYTNSLIQLNVINSCLQNDVRELVFLGSGCIYPRDSLQPIKEEYLLSGLLEKTNEAYAIAKISGIKLIESINRQFKKKYFSVMPCNIYGENDNFNLMNSHVVPALVRKFSDAIDFNHEFVEVWGSGNAFREFMHVDDLASAIIFLLKSDFQDNLINIGVGYDITIRDLVNKIAFLSGYNKEINYNHDLPDGTPKKLLDSSKMFSLGWRPQIDIDDGLRRLIEHYKNNRYNVRT